jgi:hypothetical protein
MHYVYGYFVVCVALVAWMGYAAERAPVTEAGADA